MVNNFMTVLIDWRNAIERRFRIKKKGFSTLFEIKVLKARLNGTSIFIEDSITENREWLATQDILEAEPLD